MIATTGVRAGRVAGVVAAAFLILLTSTVPASAADQVYFSSGTNVTDLLVQKINAETVRIDMSCWYLTEHSISIALLNKFQAGVPVRLIGDRGSIFEIDPKTKAEFYWLASYGVPIRLRFNPTWYPEIDHWKTTIFAGQNLVSFGSGNYTPFELAPASATNYKDEVFLFTDDPTLVGAFKTKFDQIWNDTLAEPESLVAAAPYFKNWNDACAAEPTGNCSDYATLYPNPAPMVISTARLEPDNPMPADLIWGQGPDFNNRLVTEINSEATEVDLVSYRLTVDSVTNALLQKFKAGVPVRIIMEPNEYLNRKWPEFWLTHANMDKLWAAGVPIMQRIHDGLTHMKVLITSNYTTVASSNYAAAWQRDHDYFISATGKPAVYGAIKNEFNTMWGNTAAFAPFTPQPPDPPTLTTPASSAAGVATTTSLVWNAAAFAVSYDVYFGTNEASLPLVANVPAQLVNNPPSTYSWTPATPLQPGTTYFWKVVSRTNATPVNPNLVAASSIWMFATAGTAGLPPAATTPTPSDGATGVGTSPLLGWAAGPVGVTYNVAFGAVNPPPQVATNLNSASYAPGNLSPNTAYYWQITTASSGGSTAGAIWSFTTGNGGTVTPTDVVIYASDVTTVNGTWTKVSDTTAAGGVTLSNPDAGAAALSAPLASPANYFEATFNAQAGVRYRLWLRIHAINDSKFNDSVFAQWSDSVDGSNNPIYRIGTTAGLLVNLWTCSTCQSFGWGWQRNAYWLTDTGDVWFQNSGSHTIRIQVREDGSEIDQIVMSPTTYATNAPGPVSNDNTIVAKPAVTQPPSAPASPSPASGTTNVTASPTLTWTSTGASSYDVSFGTANPPPLVVSGSTATSYTPGSLTNGTTYFWSIVARNSAGSTPGPIWSFTTSVAPPAIPSSPNPADTATGVSTSTTLTWSAAGATSYDVLLGTSQPPSQVASGLTTASYAPAGLAAGTTYFWQIVAHNSAGTNQGPQWSFTTATAAQPPAAPASPAPANGATGVSTTPTLTWSAAGATSYDVAFGTTNPPPSVAAGQTTASYTPAALAGGTTYFWQVVAHNAAGATTGPIWSFSTAVPPADVVVYASDIPAANVHGVWSATADSTSPNGIKLASATGTASNTSGPLASPADYVDVTFNAAANTPYTLWLRVQALNNSKYSDSLYVQFSDALVNGSAAYATGTTSGLVVNLATDSTGTSDLGWGWVNGAYWLTEAATVTFPTSGSHTLRIQVREYGVEFDQIVLSPATYFNASASCPTTCASAPGPVSNDTTIVPKPAAPQPPAAPGSPAPANAATGVATNASLTWTAAGATSYDVNFGTTNPPAAAATGLATASYTPAGMTNSTTYFWQVVAHNSAGTTTGPVWSFTTGAAAPGTPSTPAPTSGATGVATNASLTWTAAGATSYDVNFGTTNPPASAATGLGTASYAPASMADSTTYFWQIVAHNSGGTTTGPVWSFTTTAPPQLPSSPASPSPTDGSTGIATSATLTWTSSAATSYDLNFGTTNPPTSAATGLSAASYTPTGMTAGTTYFWQVVAHNANGTTTGPVWSFTTAAAPTNVVVYASDIPAANVHGVWAATADSTSPNGVKLATPTGSTNNTAGPLASPADYVDVTFNAAANTPYTLWLRIQALNNAKASDSLYVQFSDALVNGSAAYAMSSTSGLVVNLATDSTAVSDQAWGWVDGAYWLTQPATVTFATSGTHTLRIQVREYGVEFDQVVLSPTTYFNSSASCPNTCSGAPGPVSNDHTIVPK